PSARQIGSGSDRARPESESCSPDLLFVTAKIRMKPTNTVATMPRTIRICAERFPLGLSERSDARTLANGSLLHGNSSVPSLILYGYDNLTGPKRRLPISGLRADRVVRLPAQP